MSARQLELAFDADAPLWDASAARGGARARGRSRRCGWCSPRTARCCCRCAARRASCCCGCTACSCTRPSASCSALARNIRRRGRAADGEVRRFMNANLHRVRRSPRQMPPLVTCGRVFDLAADLRRHQRALLRRSAAGADHLGPRRRPRAPRRAHLRQLRPGARADPHPPGARPPRACRATSSRASSTTRCCTTTWAACPTARAAPSTTRAPSARREARFPQHRDGARLGEGEPAGAAARQPLASIAQRRAARAAQRSRRAPGRPRAERRPARARASR